MKKIKNYQASNAYHVAYNKAKYKRIELVLDLADDKDVIDYLESQSEPRAVFIKNIIRKEMKK